MTTGLCRNCGEPIAQESMGAYMGSPLGFRWVHVVSRIPLCAATIAEPSAYRPRSPASVSPEQTPSPTDDSAHRGD